MLPLYTQYRNFATCDLVLHPNVSYISVCAVCVVCARCQELVLLRWR